MNRSRRASQYDIYSGKKFEKKNKLKNFLKTFRGLDLFGLPVSLTHQGKSVYKTTLGSSFSVITIILVLTYFLMKLVTFINQTADLTFKAYPINRDMYDDT